MQEKQQNCGRTVEKKGFISLLAYKVRKIKNILNQKLQSVLVRPNDAEKFMFWVLNVSNTVWVDQI